MKKIISILAVVALLVCSLLALSSCSERGVDGIYGTHGKNGQNGITPTIGENGNWWIGDTDLGISAIGPKGDKGDTGAKGEDGLPGDAGEDGKPAPTPTFRPSDSATSHYEVSFDNGQTWIQIPDYDPDAV